MLKVVCPTRKGSNKIISETIINRSEEKFTISSASLISTNLEVIAQISKNSTCEAAANASASSGWRR